MFRFLSRLLNPRTTRPAKRPGTLKLEALEGREVPATLQLLGGVLNYTAATGVANNLNVSINSAGAYVFQDVENITVAGVQEATGSGTRTVTVPTSQVSAAGIAINLGDRADALTLVSSLHAISVKTGADNDVIDVGTQVGGLLLGFNAPVSVDGEGGSDVVRANDGSGFFGNYAVSANQLTRTGNYATFNLNFVNAENFTLNGGFYNDTFDVRSTSATTRTTINAGTGTDVIRVGGPSSTLDAVLGSLTIDGGGNDVGYEDQVVFDDRGSVAGHSYTLRADNSLARTGSATIAYAGFERLTLKATQFADNLGVAGIAANVPVELETWGGNDVVTIGTTTLDAVRSRVSFDGGDGADSVVLNDQADTDSNAYVISSGLVTRNEAVTLAYVGAESLALRAGAGHDSITIVSTAAQTPLLVRAGAGEDFVQIVEQSIVGINGAVTLDGEAGIDMLDYSSSYGDVRVNLSLRTATGAVGGASNFENAVGGAGNDVFVGNDAANVFYGNAGRDILIGRAGADALIGQEGDDLLVGASTAHDLSPARLEDLMREWSRTDLHGFPQSQYFTRVSHLLGLTPNGLNGTTKLTVAQVIDDGANDFLQGGAGIEWYVTSAADTLYEPEAYERITYTPLPVSPVGNVTVEVVNGNLVITEAAGSEGRQQGVRITRLPNGRYLVTGINPTGEGNVSTLINGHVALDFAISGDLVVNLGDGEDLLVIDVFGNQGPAFRDVSIDMGADNADDSVIAWYVETTGSMRVRTGGGNDWAYLGGGIIGDGVGADEYSVYSGAGSDEVTVKNGVRINGWLDVQTFDSLAENDADLVKFDTEVEVARDAHVRTGGGDDALLATIPGPQTIYFGALTTGGSLTIDLGTGDDLAYLRGVSVGGNFSLYTGAGADSVAIDARPIYNILDDTYFIPRFKGDVLVQTYDSLAETDRDEVSILNGIYERSLIVRTGGGDDYFSLEKAEIIINDLDVDMGAGNDEAEFSGYVLDHVMIRMGDGDDVLRLGKTWAYRLIADGGSGNDSLSKAYNTTAKYVDEFGWETVNA